MVNSALSVFSLFVLDGKLCNLKMYASPIAAFSLFVLEGKQLQLVG
ncbi:hypothetical protein J7M23_01840 [Candidatus Sumerlaeota bacterium]|nr:hypothetical protein [Candidatus Sumerlaeota bacterium]